VASRSPPPPPRESSPSSLGTCSPKDYAWARLALHAKKLRDLEFKAGLPARRGQKGTAAAYSTKSARERERRWVTQAEHAYQRFVTGWQPKGQESARAPQMDAQFWSSSCHVRE